MPEGLVRGHAESDRMSLTAGTAWTSFRTQHTAPIETCHMERRLVEECFDNRRVGLLPCGSWPENSKWRRRSPFGLDPTQGLKESRHRLGCVLAGNEEGVRGLEVGDGPPGPSKTVASKEKKK